MSWEALTEHILQKQLNLRHVYLSKTHTGTDVTNLGLLDRQALLAIQFALAEPALYLGLVQTKDRVSTCARVQCVCVDACMYR
jgi:hypothetical protein